MTTLEPNAKRSQQQQSIVLSSRPALISFTLFLLLCIRSLGTLLSCLWELGTTSQKVEKGLSHGKSKHLKGGGQGGKMPSPQQMLTNQETASLTREGLMPQMEAPLRECSRLLQAKYLISDSQQTHKLIPTHIHTQMPFSGGPETELNVPLQQFE